MPASLIQSNPRDMKSCLMIVFSILFLSLNLQAQVEVSGVVKDADTGLPLPGVSILITGTTIGTVSDMEGKYKISVSPGARLWFSYIGFVDQKIAVGSQTVIDVFLAPDPVELDEVVVTSLGISRDRMAISYSTTEVSGDEFIEARENNIADALSGKIAGVNVSNIASGPAGASRVVIRGVVSMMQNNQPLYVLDGLPINNTSFDQAGMWGGSDWGDGTISINPDDIESINVLKGANASALYGSRASNGVILITTKKGEKRKGIGVEIGSNFVLESIIDYTDPQTSYGHGYQGNKPEDAIEGFINTHRAWGAALDSTMSYTFDAVERPYVNTFADGGNNIKKFYQKGYTWTNYFAVSGGSDRQRARFSVSHLTNQGIIPNSGFERLNMGLNYNGQYGKFNVDAKLYYSREEAKNRPQLSDMPGNANNTVLLLPSSIDVRTLKGDPEKPGAVYEGQNNPPIVGKTEGEELQVNGILPWFSNPYWAAYQFVNDNTRNRVMGQASLRYDFTNYLYAQVRAGLDWQTNRFTHLTPYGTSFSKLGGLQESQHQIQETNFEWILGFNKMWNQFGINAFIGGNAMENLEEIFIMFYTDFNIPYFHTPSNTKNLSQDYVYLSSGINSLFGSLELSWGGYLYLTATARNDWFSTLDPSKNSILYPSVGLSWVFSDLFSMPSWWDLGKIRASWAQVGGATTPYNLYQTYSFYNGGTDHLGRSLGQIEQTINPNQDLVPLTSTEAEIGLDIGFFNNRLGLDISFYDQTTRDDIIPATIPQSSGYGQTWINVGEVENRGYEVLLRGSPIRREFTWDIEINFAENRNKVIKISDEIDRTTGIGSPATRSRTGDAFLGYWEGEPYSVISGFKQKMINGQKVIDSNGFPVRNDSLVIMGYGIHPYTGGISNTFSLKGFYLSFLIDVKLGADIHSGTNGQMTSKGLHKQTLTGRADSLLSTGVDETGEPLSVWVTQDKTSEYWWAYGSIANNFMYDASFIRLRQLTFGYTFPEHLLSKTPFSFINLSFVARNLALLYHNTENIDPESTYNNYSLQGLEYSGVPPTRTYGFNLQMKF